MPTIIFDFGGVLINDRSSDPILHEAASKIPAETLQKYKKILTLSELGQIPYQALLEADKILFPDKSEEWIRDFFLNTEIYEPWNIAEKLYQRFPVIIFSNNHIGAPEEVARNLNMDISKFPFINSANVGMRKPQLEFYSYLIDSCKLKPRECIFIDNMAHNLAPADKLGMKTFHYTRNDNDLLEFLRKEGVTIN